MSANPVIDKIGHGAFGLRSGLRLFGDFMEDSGSQRDMSAELRPGSIITGWSIDSGATYVTFVETMLDNQRLDVVSVKSLLDTGLTRAESLALCRSTAGTYYYDPDEEFLDPFVWDSDQWDDGVSYWDQSPKLYVHLTDGSDPNQTSVSAQFGLFYGTRGAVHPTLGDEKLTNGTLEDWASSTDMIGMVENVSAGHTITQETATVFAGTYSAKLASDGSQATGNCFINSTQKVSVVGKMYRVVVIYQTPEGFDSANQSVQLAIQDGDALTNWVCDDGRTAKASRPTGLTLAPTNGEWRMAFFDFIAPWAMVNVRFDLVTTAAAACSVFLDSMSLKRIYRWNYYEPRIVTSNVPSVDTGSNDIYFGGKRIGIGSVSFNNGDGKLEKVIGQLEWLNHEMIIWAGGQFNDGQEIAYHDQRRQFTGLIQGYDVSDDTTNFDIQDSRIFFHVKLPRNTYNESIFPNIDPLRVGLPRPLWFGAKENITGTRIDKDGTFSKYGVYELADCSDSPAGINQITAIKAYTDDDAAAGRKSAFALTLVTGQDYSEDLTNGRFTILRDVGPYNVTSENNKLNFNIGAGQLTATITKGLYTANGLAAQIATKMTAAAGGTISCSYSESTNKFTISKGAGTLQLLLSTGTNKEITGYSLIGFQRGSDATGALTYTSDDATFASADTDHILRTDGLGYQDDVNGKYTGTPSALIQIGADICQVLIERYLKKSYALIDQTSFLFARSRAPESLAIYLKETTSTKDLFDTLEFSNVANIVIDGSGMIYYKVYVGDVPASTPNLYDRDYLQGGFLSSRSISDVYRSIQVQYNKDPSSDSWLAASAADSSVELRFGRTDLRVFETFIKIGDNAAALASRLLTLAKRPARKVKVITRSKLIDREVGDKVVLTRKRAMDVNGQINGQTFRIISIKKNPLEGRVEADLVDDVVTVAGIQCITACQLVCELSNQSICVVQCQETCQLSGCQTGCQATCQGCGQTVCQLVCEATTQGGCATGCQVACQSTCQRSCQACGQAGHCQTSCETHCQGCGQTSCQTSCELSCQTQCQLSCQASCQQFCQVASEYNQGH